jgi:8-oxo-dGTP pyrophosphatase MutT (NUDIX family)
MSVPIRKRGVVAVVLRGEKLLVIRRSQHVRAPGMHCFPGGTIEEGESEAEAVVREMQEELSAAVVAVRPLWRYVTSWGVDLAWWLVTLPEDAALQHNPLEVEEFYWLTPAEIATLPQLLESNSQFLTAMAAGEFVIEGLE